MSRYAEDDPDFVWDEDPPPGQEWLTDYYEDDYPTVDATASRIHMEEQDGVGFDYEEFAHARAMHRQPSVAHILEECIEPVVSSASLHVGKLILWCFVVSITTQSCTENKRHESESIA